MGEHEVKLGWGKAIPIPPVPFFVLRQEHEAPVVPTGIPFNARARKGIVSWAYLSVSLVEIRTAVYCELRLSVAYKRAFGGCLFTRVLRTRSIEYIYMNRVNSRCEEGEGERDAIDEGVRHGRAAPVTGRR